MMPKRFWIVLGVVVAVVLIGFVTFYYLDPSRAVVTGSILKVRVQPVDESSCLVVVDFRFINSSTSVVVVRSVAMEIEDQSGKPVQGEPLSEMDAKRLMDYYPLLGQKYNETLLMKTKIEPRQSMDRMVAARFAIPDSQFNARKQLKVEIEDWGGPVSVIEQVVGKK
jgi:hypothetical protein